MSAEAADELATSANVPAHAGTFAEAGGNVQVRALGPVGPQGAHGAQPHLARLVNTSVVDGGGGSPADLDRLVQVGCHPGAFDWVTSAIPKLASSPSA